MSPTDCPHRESRCHAHVTRRACLSALTVAGVTGALPAMAQIDWHKVDIWKPYRREDLGFEVELPGEPEIEEEQDEHTKSISAEFLFVGMMFGVDHVTFRHDVTIADVVGRQREGAQNLKSRITRESPFTMDGYPAVEIAQEMDNAFGSIMRVVVIGNRAIAFNVVGNPDIAGDPSALRFLNSIKLLPTAPTPSK